MAPDGIVEAVHVAGNGLSGFGAGVKDGSPDKLGFNVLKNVSTMAKHVLSKAEGARFAVIFGARFIRAMAA